MKFFYVTVKLTDTFATPPLHHAWKSAVHPEVGPISIRDAMLEVLSTIRTAGIDESLIRNADWRVIKFDNYELESDSSLS